MFFSPLCPPAEPPSRMRSFPGSRATSSEMTMIRSGGTLKKPAACSTASPDRFIKVTGFMRSTVSPPRAAVLVKARYFSRWTGMSSVSAIWSTTSKPTLCRVPSYRSPVLPSPTTSQETGPLGFWKNSIK